jgi:hypothetical protein
MKSSSTRRRTAHSGAGEEANTLAELLASWEPLEEEFPDADDGLLSLDDIKL